MSRLALIVALLFTGCRTTRMEINAPLQTRFAAWEAAGPVKMYMWVA